MSQSPKDPPAADAVDLSKRAEPAARPARWVARPAAAADADVEVPPRPRMIDFVVYALGLQVIFGFGIALGLHLSTSTFTTWIYQHVKNPDTKKLYDPAVASDRSAVAGIVRNQQNGALIGAIVFGLALVFLAVALRRYRSANVARWAIVIVMVLTQRPFYVIPVAGWSPLAKVSSVIVGAAAIATIVLLFLPESRRWFKACRAAMTPAGATPRPGLGSLFAGRFAPQAAAPSTPSTPTASSRAAGAPRPKAKTRVDEAAVARGAELARNRAKASKSRKTDA